MRSDTSNRVNRHETESAGCCETRASVSVCDAMHTDARNQVTGSAPFHSRGIGARPSGDGGSRLSAEVSSLLVDLVELVERYKSADHCEHSRSLALTRNNQVGTGSTDSRSVLGSSGQRGAANPPVTTPRTPENLSRTRGSSNHRGPVRTGLAVPSLRVRAALALAPATIFPDPSSHVGSHARKPACSGVHNYARSGAITAACQSVRSVPSVRDGRSVGPGGGLRKKEGVGVMRTPESARRRALSDDATCLVSERHTNP